MYSYISCTCVGACVDGCVYVMYMLYNTCYYDNHYYGKMDCLTAQNMNTMS